jgi:hypothetical protein
MVGTKFFQWKTSLIQRSIWVNKIICPKCLSENNEDRITCWECGEELDSQCLSIDKQTPHIPSESAKTQIPMPSRNIPSSQKRYSSGLASLSFNTKYHALKSIADFCNLIAIIFAVVGGIGVFLGFVILLQDTVLGLVVIVGACSFGVSGYVGYKIIAEGISVILDIEMNTRQTATFTKLLVEDREV